MGTPGHPDRERTILSLWERAMGRGGWRRAEALLAGTAASQALGERNRALLKIRGALFGRTWPLSCDCPACGTACSFAVDSVALADGLEGDPLAKTSSSLTLSGRSIEVRAPTADDLSFVGGTGDPGAAERELLARCLPPDLDPSELEPDEVDALGRLIEGLDPAAVIVFALACPECGQEWSSPIDVADVLWTEVQRAAELSLIDVDALARCYGWTEDQIFALSPIRRAAYLQLVAAP